jgi:hypothetical protein
LFYGFTFCRHFGHKDRKTQQRACEHASILLSLENLVTYPWIRDRLLNETIAIHGWYFDFEGGELWGLNADTHAFEPLVDMTSMDEYTEHHQQGYGYGPKSARLDGGDDDDGHCSDEEEHVHSFI